MALQDRNFPSTSIKPINLSTCLGRQRPHSDKAQGNSPCTRKSKLKTKTFLIDLALEEVRLSSRLTVKHYSSLYI